ncbi:LysR family transcriptional regulator [Roseateles chitinivorans]|uniref:LysR family transcriptional regulator n=1 Tax=Roseateles chitinivorans TaxID=2917965 RepID=UPI003D6663CA
MKDLDWNDLRFVVAVAREGSAAAAARALGVSNATVLRRISAIEADIGSPLFDRLATGYVANEAGRTLTLAGESMDAAIVDARRSIEGKASALSGTVRFTTTDSLAFGVLPALLQSFRAKFPEIQVELLVTNNALNLDRRDADVTLRPSTHPPETWVGMRLLRMDFAVYVASASASAPSHDAAAIGATMAAADWLWPDGSLSGAAASRWLASAVSDERAVLRVDSFVAMQAMAGTGLGAALLPRFLGEGQPLLKRVADAPREASADLWILTHPTLRHSPRVQTFLSHLSEGLRQMRERFEAPD